MSGGPATFYRTTGQTATPEDVVDCARSYIGTPYRDWGRRKGTACDCIGLPILVGQELGLFTGDFTRYRPTPKARNAEEVADTNMAAIHWTRPGWETARPDYEGPVNSGSTPVGAVGLFWFSHRREPTHFAIFARHPHDPEIVTMIHAHALNKRVTENSLNDFWRRRLVKSYWMPGVEVAMLGGVPI